MTLEIEYDPANATHKNAAAGLIADLIGRASTTYTLVFPDTGSTEWSFSAFVTGFDPSADHAADLTATVTMKPTGDMTLA